LQDSQRKIAPGPTKQVQNDDEGIVGGDWLEVFGCSIGQTIQKPHSVLAPTCVKFIRLSAYNLIRKYSIACFDFRDMVLYVL
jgi:hypothetical protein